MELTLQAISKASIFPLPLLSLSQEELKFAKSHSLTVATVFLFCCCHLFLLFAMTEQWQFQQSERIQRSTKMESFDSLHVEKFWTESGHTWLHCCAVANARAWQALTVQNATWSWRLKFACKSGEQFVQTFEGTFRVPSFTKVLDIVLTPVSMNGVGQNNGTTEWNARQSDCQRTIAIGAWFTLFLLLTALCKIVATKANEIFLVHLKTIPWHKWVKSSVVLFQTH